MRAQYAICVTRNFYGSRTTKHRLVDNETGREWRGTYAEARAMLSEIDNSTYYTSHGESGRAEYTIVYINPQGE